MIISFFTIFLISGAYLSYEILLMRNLSILNWSHYAYMVISLAMLGLGFSGVIISVFDKFFKKNMEKCIWLGCFIFSITIPLAFYINLRLPFNYLYLIWDWNQIIYLGIRYLIYGIPFLVVSTLIALFFLKYPKNSNLVYGINLLGSGFGILFSIFIMHIISPEKYLMFSAFLSIAGGFIWGMKKSNARILKVLTVLVCFVVIFLNFIFSNQDLSKRVSEYKALSGLIRLPTTRVTNRFYNPLGVIHVLDGDNIRLLSGLSVEYRKKILPHKALTIDGDSASAIIDSIEDVKELDFLDYMIFSAGYKAVSHPNTLIIGAGGMIDVLLAHYHNSESVDIVEVNPNVIKAVKKEIDRKTTKNYFKQNVNINIKEAREYFETTSKKFNLIQLNPFGALSSSAAGVYSQNEDYLNTIESYNLFYDKLTPDGIFMISKWVKSPPRDGIKLFATIYEMLEQKGVDRPEKHLFMIRNWDILTLLVKSTPFTAEQIQKLVNFSHDRNFDISYFYGIKQHQLNLYHRLSEPFYYQAANKIIDSQERQEFYNSYIFNIRPPTDNRPYFSHFFKWSALPHLIKTLGREWLPFSEFGYLSLIITFIQSIIIGFIIIILPLFILLKNKKDYSCFKFRVWVYFMVLGFFYMVFVMSFIQKFMLFLYHPIYSSAVVISSFLLFSGLGSITSRYFFKKNIQKFQFLPFIIIIFLGLIYAFYLDKLFFLFRGANISIRLIISFFTISPLAFFIGMPFPLGMHIISPSGVKNVGAAWGYNGYFSVLGVVFVPVVSVLTGFRMLVVLGAIGYLIALFLWIKNFRNY